MLGYQKIFISNLKKARKDKGISQAELAEKCNVSNGTIGNIECGITNPSFDLIFQIAEALEIPPAFLFKTESDDLYSSTRAKQGKENLKKSISDSLNEVLIDIYSKIDSFD